MNRYEATVRPQGPGPRWVVEVDGIGATRGRTASEARDLAADMVAAALQVPAAEIAVDVHFALDSELEREILAARRAAREAQEAQEKAAKLSRRAVLDLKESGMTGRDVATVLGPSPQRVSQLSRG